MLPGLLLSVAIALLFQAPTAVKAPKDFWLRLKFGCGDGTDTVDTAAGTYVRWGYGKPQVAHVWVSPKVKDQLFTLVFEARFFDTQTGVIGLGICEPSTNYRLEVMSNGKSHGVSWGDCHLPAAQAGQDGLRMRTLAEDILKPFQAMGAVKQLRPPNWTCL
jgi:hypothetical protein